MSAITERACKNPLLTATIAWLILSFEIAAAARGGWMDKGADMLKSLGGTTGKTGLSSADIAAAFKAALHIGTENVVARLGRTDGFNTDPAIHIPLPDQMETVRSALAKFGMSQSLDDLETQLNRAAENATPKAKALFVDGIFYYGAKEEAAIRRDPVRQTTDLLKRVFGAQ